MATIHVNLQVECPTEDVDIVLEQLEDMMEAFREDQNTYVEELDMSYSVHD